MAVLAVALLAAACGSGRSEADFADHYRQQAREAPVAEGAEPADAATALGPVEVVGPGATATGPGGAGPAARTDGAAPTGAARRPTGTRIRIGHVGTRSGPVGATLAPGVAGAQAWAASVNATGGIDGHPVELLVADDGADPARHRALVQEMVEEHDVVAFVHSTAPLSGQSAITYLQERGIPVIGSDAGSPWFLTSPMHFPQTTSDIVASTAAGTMLAEVGRALGLRRVGLVRCVEARGCATTTDADAYEAAGLDVVAQANVSLAQPDYTAVCLTARDRGAEMLFALIDGQGVRRLATNCAAIGYRPLLGVFGPSVGPPDLADPVMDGAYVMQLTAPWFQTSNPAVAEYDRALRAYAPATPPGSASIHGWVSGKVLERALRAAPDPTTSAGIVEGLHTIDHDDLGGLTYPLVYRRGPQGHGAEVPACWWLIRIRSGRFVSADDGRRHCAAG